MKMRVLRVAEMAIQKKAAFADLNTRSMHSAGAKKGYSPVIGSSAPRQPSTRCEILES
jgi:hypothetical protein